MHSVIVFTSKLILKSFRRLDSELIDTTSTSIRYCIDRPVDISLGLGGQSLFICASAARDLKFVYVYVLNR